MLYKTIVPDATQLGLNPVLILKISSKGLDKTAAMQKRAAAFTDVIADILPMLKKAYLHVITTGAYLAYGPQRNCFVAGTKVITARGSKNILDIQIGLLVKTGVGTYRPVLATMKRAYSGTLVSVKCSGVPLRVIMTTLHPVLCVTLKQWKYNYARQHNGLLTKPFGLILDNIFLTALFTLAILLLLGYRLLIPNSVVLSDFVLPSTNIFSKRSKLITDTLSLLFAYCLGLWVALGSVLIKKPTKTNNKYRTNTSIKKAAIVYSLHEYNDSKSILLLKQFCTTNNLTISVLRCHSSLHCIKLKINSVRLVDLFTSLAGRGAKNKFLSRLLFNKSALFKYNFIAGLFDGDGCISKSGKLKGAITLSTTSISLVNDLQLLLSSLDIACSTTKSYNKVSNGCFGRSDNVIYALSVSASKSLAITKYTKRLLCIKYLKEASFSKNYITNNKSIVTRIQLLLTFLAPLLCFVYNLLVALLHTFCVPFVVHNCDAFNLDYLTIHPPLAKTASAKTIQLDGGLKKYHDSSYSSGKAKVYQLHQTEQQGALASGIVKCARYNDKMHRGLLLIEVDSDKWALRLNKRASGQDIFLSIGCSLDHDVCSVCGNIAHTLKLHCDHVNMHKLAVYLDGTRCCMFNDAPSFYDISGVNVPADPIAFVLRKVASGLPAQKSIALSRYMVGTRSPMVINKAASLLNKLSKMLKAIVCNVSDDPLFEDSDLVVDDFLKAVLNYPADLIISGCNRKAILLSPKMLFKIIGKLTDQSELFNMFADSCPCCGKHLMEDMTNDLLFANLLRDGSFDTITPVDLNLDSILLKFMTLFGVSRPAINGKSIRITIRIGTKPKLDKDLTAVIKAMELNKELLSVNTIKFVSNNYLDLQNDLLDILKKASLVNDLFRRTYARYVLSFALRNSLDTCNLALQKIARYR